ncbi:MAG: VanZ family protein [Clostridia bacterium]|nr:VanZ family protein [Clostridia bacterium]
MSAEPATVSADRSGGVTEKVMLLLVPDFEEKSEAEKAEMLSAADHVIRKTAHFCIFGVLGGLSVFISLGYFAKKSAHIVRSEVFCALYAASDEIHQYFVPGRGPKLTDVVIDSVGAFCGIAFILIVALKWKERKNGS